jgi:hypothetical protein
MNLIDVLKVKFPNATIGFDIIIQDNSDGKGLFISQWNVQGVTQPTSQDVITWSNDSSVVASAKFNDNKIKNIAIYSQLDTIDSQSIRALRVNDSARLTALENKAIALRAQLLPTS